MCKKLNWIWNKVKELIDLKALFWVVVILFGWIAYQRNIMSGFNRWVLPLLDIETGAFGLFLVFAAAGVYVIYHSIKRKYFMPLWLLSSLVCFIVIYGYERSLYIAIPSWQICHLHIGYTDILIALLAIYALIGFIFFVIGCTRLLKKLKKANSSDTESDKPIEDKMDDKLHFYSSVEKEAKLLNEMSNDELIPTGVIGPWGSGKTSYLNLLENELKKLNKKNIVIRINPRHSHNTQTIQEDFFNALFSELEKYDFRFSHSFKDYLKAIDVVAENKILSAFLSLHKAWDKEVEKEKIDTAIKQLGRRIFVIIDDLDRLMADEIIEVFKLIDGNASFYNIAFISAYDKQRINDIIKKEYSDEDAVFSDKFFSREIHVPLRPDYEILNSLKTTLISKEIDDISRITQVIDDHKEIFSKFLTTIRDVKRYSNILLPAYRFLRNEVEFGDFALLMLIKYKYPTDYRNLFSGEYTRIREDDSLDIEECSESQTVEYKPVDNSMFLGGNKRIFCDESIENNEQINQNVKDILSLLFSSNRKPQQNSINQSIKFGRYFYESVDGYTSQELTANLIDNDLENAKRFIDNAIQE